MYRNFYRAEFRKPTSGEWYLSGVCEVRRATGHEGMARIMVPADGWDGIRCRVIAVQGLNPHPGESHKTIPCHRPGCDTPAVPGLLYCSLACEEADPEPVEVNQPDANQPEADHV